MPLKPTPYRALADELIRTRHPYRCWPPNAPGTPCVDCGRIPDNVAHRHLELVLWEAGLRSAEEVFDPLRGYWDPAVAQEKFMAKVIERQEAKATRQVEREEAGATSWLSKKKEV